VARHDLVLLHGQPGLGAEWQQVVASLPAQVRALAPDRPGHGSSRQAGGGLAVNAATVLAELDACGIERAVLVGHSYGGGVAIDVAARAPDRVEALVLLASVGPDCLNGWDWLLSAPVAGLVCSLFAWKLTPWFARARLRGPIRRMGAERAARRYVNWYAWGYTQWDHGPLWRTFLTEQRALMREAGQIAGLAERISVPVLVMADPKDTLVPFRTATALAGLLPDARLRRIEGAGHHLPLRAPAEVASEIAGFLESLDARTPAGE
jgi:pimeloyl-ACP methyl ester carboxylesterase